MKMRLQLTINSLLQVYTSGPRMPTYIYQPLIVLTCSELSLVGGLITTFWAELSLVDYISSVLECGWAMGVADHVREMQLSVIKL